MFLHLSVILFTGGKVCREGGVVDTPDQEADIPPPTDPEADTLPLGPKADTLLHPEADTPSSLVEAATEAGGTHPTGMHSC